MPRKARLKSDMGIYHIILRSVNQQIIFEEESDFLKFIYTLSDCKEKYDFDIYAYCLMSNHIHILLRDYDNRLSSIFQSIESRYARWYNQKYQRFGHLFQERFFSNPIQNEQYFISALIYINYNPVKSNMCRYVTDYRWSSARAYFGDSNPLVDITFVCTIFGSRKNLMSCFANEEYISNDYSIPQSKAQPDYFNDDSAFIKFKQISKCKSPSDIQKLPKVERNRIVRLLADNKLSYSQIAMYCGITKTTVYRIINEYK